MDAAVLDMKHCADLFLFSTTFPVNHLLPPDHKETQPFHPAVQRSADSSSNPRGPTQPHPNPTSQATTLTYCPNPISQAATLTYRSNPTFRAATLTYRPNPISRAATLTYRPEKPAREAYFSRSPPSHKKRTATDLKSTTVLQTSSNFYFPISATIFSFNSRAFFCGSSAFMIADTTAIPLMPAPSSTSIFPAFNPPIATAGIATASQISFKVETFVRIVTTLVVVG